MTKPRVNIVMAVYNGEAHVASQLDSILDQTYENFHIYVRDDNPSDNTADFVRSYIKEKGCGDRVTVYGSEGVNLRCPGSFYKLLELAYEDMHSGCVSADKVYYAFADQDDIWYPEKIEWAVEKLEEAEKENKENKMLVYYSASDYKTGEGDFLRKSAPQKENLELIDVLYYTPGSAFTMVFNEETVEKMVIKVSDPGNELHDRWILRGAACFGRAIYDERSSATHVRYDESVTAGDSSNGSLLKYFIKEELMGDESRKMKEDLGYFYKTFGAQLTFKESRILKLFTRKNSFSAWLCKVFYPKRLRRRLGGEIALRILFFLGRI